MIRAARLRTAVMRVAILALAVGAGLAGTELVLAAPPASDFTVSPTVPLPGQPATFTASGLKPSDTVSWDFDNDGAFDATGSSAIHAFATSGLKTVRMVVTKEGGETQEVVKVLRVDAPPSASLTASPNPATIGAPVQFDAGASSDADGTIVSYAWDLDGNGSFETVTGSTPTTSKAYTVAGTVNVGLRVTDNDGATATTTVPVIVGNNRPVASFTATPNPATVGQAVQFNASGSSDPDGTVASYAWDLDDDGQFDDASGVTATRSFAAAGTHTVRLRVTDDGGATDTAVLGVTVNNLPPPPVPNQPPTASVSASPNPAGIGQTVQFNASGSSDPDGTIASYAWDLDGNGSFETVTGSTPTASKAYTAPGTVNVRLRVTDNAGATAEIMVPVVVQNGTPVASLTASPNPATAGEAVQFSAAGSSDPDGTIASQEWDLDNDGQFDDASGATATRTFATAGSHVVRLLVTDNHGAKDTATLTVTVGAAGSPPPPPNRPPIASFAVVPPQPAVGDTVQFVSTSVDPDGPIASYAWDLHADGRFDDSSRATAAGYFVTPGFYTVSLRVTDSAGATDVESRTVLVSARSLAASLAPSELMSPFPVVRLVARLTRRGANVRLLQVRGAPRGSTVTVRCRGRGCRTRVQSKPVTASPMRFRAFERRLRAGATLRIRITQPGKLGKYTSFKIRRLRSPLRRDMCVATAGSRPVACPS